ncbi:MAG TPA: metallophosphoesterase family protein [Planctomycetota bacterium]|nr:metallophosphoesterase family protein [Planctomycetota bacterium]
MSRRAVISDIHGNLVALEAVLADIQTQKVDQIVCLGDICGYGPQPVECINRVRETCAWSLRGNHDEALFNDPIDFGKNALTAIMWQRTIMQPKPGSPADVVERWNWLKNLPTEHSEKDVLFVHASPRDPLYEYVLREDFDDQGFGPTQKAKDIFSAMEWLCFCGHSHRPGVVAEDYKWILPAEIERSYIIKRGFKTIVNIGSVGQPRDGISDACYVIFDYKPPDHTKTTQIPKPADAESTLIQTKDSTPTPPPGNKGTEEDTRYGQELQQARDTALLNMPRVTFRRVKYDIAEAQARFRAVPELPENNGLRLAKGL